jgi:hypothetical protein
MSNRAVCIVALVCIGHALESAFWRLFGGWCIVPFRLGFQGRSICMPYRASYHAKRLACCFRRARSGTQRKMCFIAMIYMIQPLRVDKTANQKRANGGMWIGSCSMKIFRDYNRSLPRMDSICPVTLCVCQWPESILLMIEIVRQPRTCWKPRLAVKVLVVLLFTSDVAYIETETMRTPTQLRFPCNCLACCIAQ